MRSKTLVSVCCGFALLAIFGCGGSGRLGVSGKVIFKGEPLDQGTIEFSPASSEVKAFAGAEIKDGTYSIPASQGLLPGEYKVKVSSADPNDPGATDEFPGESDKIAKDRIPEEYNVNTKLTYTVEAGKTNTFDVKIP